MEEQNIRMAIIRGRPSGFSVRRIVGKGNLWITEYVIIYEGKRVYTVSIMEFRDGKVSHETQLTSNILGFEI